MGTHMRTTIEISDALLEAARARAQQEGTTLRSLVEEGLRHVLEDASRAEGFTLRDASVPGRGLDPEVREGRWETVRALIYEGRGA